MGPPESKKAVKRVSESGLFGYPENTENTENTENMKIVVLLAEMHTFEKMRKVQESEIYRTFLNFSSPRVPGLILKYY